MKTATWLLACVGLLSAASASAAAQRNIEELRSGTAHRDLYALAVNTQDPESAVAVGAFGELVETSDGGKTWTEKNIDTDRALLDIALVGNHEIIVGQSGMVLIRDGEGAWKEIKVDTDARLLGVAANESGLTFAVGQFGAVLRSRDGGKNWQKLDLKLAQIIEGGYDPHLYDVYVSADGVATVVGEFGLIMRSTDGGDNWVIVNTSDESLFAMQMRDDGVGFAVGQSGVVFRSEDGGKTWARLANKLDANLLGVWSTPDGKVTAPGFRHMLVSDNNGETWQQLENQDVNRGWYIAARTIGSEPGVVAVGYFGRIIRITETKN